jgi:hypothetical protein
LAVNNRQFIHFSFLRVLIVQPVKHKFDDYPNFYDKKKQSEEIRSQIEATETMELAIMPLFAFQYIFFYLKNGIL